ncbi:cytochrome P450 [Amycolatopsis japonica]|uniref:cytochrome P450 n=1 Tax=Amycolatopsis japonica TaxID=208439 RepID=UPI0036730C9C
MSTTEVPGDADAEIHFDHHSPSFRQNPYKVFSELRNQCPVVHSTAHGGFWVLTDHASVYEAARDDTLFSSAETVGIPPSGMPFPIIPSESDPPQTQQFRTITLSAFSPKAVKALHSTMREIATELIDSFVERGECDIVAELTNPLPARMMLRMLGFDESTWQSWVDRAHAVIHDRTHSPEAAQAAAGSIMAELGREIAKRRDADPEADVFARIVHGTVDGNPLNDDQIMMYGLQMILGGMDTTSGLTSNTLFELCTNSDVRDRLLEDRSLLPAATEEFLRHGTPVLNQARTVTRDAEFHGRRLRKGDRVMLAWASANHDPTVFENPEQVDLDRTDVRHLSFGVGAHRCLGSNLAREMFVVMLDEVLTRLPDFHLSGTPEKFPDAGEVHAMRRMRIAFTPGPRVGV